MAKPVFFRVHEAAVASFVAPGGAVSGEVNKVTKATVSIAAAMYPQRTGKLAGGVRRNLAKPSSPSDTSGLVYNNVKYARWVEEGTGTITPHGKLLTVPKNRSAMSGAALKVQWAGGGGDGVRPFFLAKSVRGQAGQHVLRKSYAMAMKRY